MFYSNKIFHLLLEFHKQWNDDLMFDDCQENKYKFPRHLNLNFDDYFN